MAYPTGELSISLHAIVQNWRSIQKFLSVDTVCGAVVKANAYGLGVERIAPVLYEAGCRQFFVANLKEAIQLQSLVGRDVEIFVLSGCIAGAEEEFILRKFIPVIVSIEMLGRWHSVLKKQALLNRVDLVQTAVKVNTGMGRLGCAPDELSALLDSSNILQEINITWLMSHLACADESSHPLNGIQLQRFSEIKNQFYKKDIPVRCSFANSDGVFLGEGYHQNLVRPGIALYGGGSHTEDAGLLHVVDLHLPIIQLHKVAPGECVGYGASRCFDKERIVAVVAGGYADGIMRSLGNSGYGWVRGCKVPIVGRISMDSTIFDVTDVENGEMLKPGDGIELLGGHISINELAQACGTIGYEIITAFGARYQRSYLD